MADYYALIKKAVARLDLDTRRESRWALYDRARLAQITQLRTIDPPLSEAEQKFSHRRKLKPNATNFSLVMSCVWGTSRRYPTRLWDKTAAFVGAALFVGGSTSSDPNGAWPPWDRWRRQ